MAYHIDFENQLRHRQMNVIGMYPTVSLRHYLSEIFPFYICSSVIYTTTIVLMLGSIVLLFVCCFKGAMSQYFILIY